ncbi:hypothetical protein CPC08DRAFT_696026 [Agrocybe pediades]|nr:hypothetical protein CPC08DRAFT_696026 [Agrocybe pediades]
MAEWVLGHESQRKSTEVASAHEMLHIIHQLTSVLTPEVKAIVLNNWLVNPSGKPNSWVKVDLLQEHLNFWIKTFYKAHGSNASWEWLASIAPCVDMLRKLARNFHQMLGADQGPRHHIDSLMVSLSEHKVYEIQKGRTLDNDDPPVKDILSVGFDNLTAGTKSPLAEYNEAFQRLQQRRRMKPVNPTKDTVSNEDLGPSQAEQPDKLTNDQGRTQATEGGEVNLDDPDIEVAEPPPSELELIMEDLEQGKVDIIFPVTGEEDVALDMDTVDLDSESDDEGMYTSDEEYCTNPVNPAGLVTRYMPDELIYSSISFLGR